MKGSGRLTVLLIVVCSFLIWSAYFYYVLHHFIPVFVLAAALYAVLGWFLGLQYDKAKYYAEHDVLTCLHNRRYVYSQVGKLKDRTVRREAPYAVFLLDVYRFKQINDELGHEAGDRLLQTIGKTLGQTLGGSGLVARWGCDEFLVVIERVTSGERLDLVREHIRSSLPSEVDIAIGSALYGQDGDRFDELVAHADRNRFVDNAFHKNITSK